MISPGTPPTMDLGCVPQGTWTVEVTVSSEGSCGEVPMPTTYTYLVEGTGHNTTINPTNNLDQEAAVNITANSQGHCDASFEHIWPAADGYNVALLKPESPTWLQTIEGTGTYQLWAEHP
jgi:hypothetical protein